MSTATRLVVLAAIVLPLAAAEPEWAKLDSYAVDLLQRYIRIDTSNPPANTAPAAALLKAEFERHGFTVRLLDAGSGRVNLVTRLAGRDRAKKPLLLLNHMDVVPVDRSRWSVDPFGGLIKDGWLWGRGALDMKGTGVQHMIALIAAKQAGVVPARDIVFVASCDEEAGGTWGVRWMLKHHPQELDVEYALDEGGFLTRDVLSNGPLMAAVSVGEKQVAWIKLRAQGTAGHGSQPIAENANDILLRAIERARDLPPRLRATTEVLDGKAPENKFTNAIQRNTMSLTTLRSGVGDPPKANVIPSIAEATIDCRLLPGVDAAEFVSEIRARINDPRVTVTQLSQPEDPGSSPSDTPLFRALSAAIRKHHADATVAPIVIPYGTDSAVLRKNGVKAYGFFAMTLDAPTLATFHSDEERVPIAEFLKGIRIFYDVIRSDF